MKIMDFLKEKAVSAHLKSKTKREVIEELIALLAQAGEIENKEEIMKALLDREKLGSTGIGDGVAIPHAKSDVVNEVVAAFGRSPQGVEFDSLDGEPAYLFFLLVAPTDSTGPHLKALARLSRILKDKPFRETLKKAETEEEMLKLIREEDSKKVFAPFFTTKSSYTSGTGIGMYVVKRIIEENHKGRVWFESEYMKGTRFFIELPGRN